MTSTIADIRLLWMTMFVVICVVLGYVFDLKPVKDVCKNIGEKLSPHEEYISWLGATQMIYNSIPYSKQACKEYLFKAALNFYYWVNKMRNRDCYINIYVHTTYYICIYMHIYIIEKTIYLLIV